jgi:Putative amidoligase enzyme
MRRFLGIKYRSFSSRRPFGVELEVNNNLPRRDIKKAIQQVSDIPVRIASGWDQSIGNQYWHIKTDATCGIDDNSEGWEIASYKCSGFEDIIHLGVVADSIRATNAKVNRSCGLHVHVEVADFSVNQIGILLAWWLKIERVIFHSIPLHRSQNAFCMPMRNSVAIASWDTMPSPFRVWSMFRPESVEVHENEDRHRAVNLVNYLTSLYDPEYKRVTVEFRFPDGTLNPSDVKNWPRLLVQFVESVKRRVMPSNFDICDVPNTLSILGLHHDDNFYIFSEGLMETKTWFLKRVMKYCRDRHDWGLQAKRVLDDMYQCRKIFR